MVREYLLRQDINVSQLARMCGTSQANMSKKLKLNEMDSGWIARISTALKHDFFADLSHEWKKENMGGIVSEPSVEYGKHNILDDYIEGVVVRIISGKKK